MFGEALARGFIAPSRYGLADLSRYAASLRGIKLEISRDLKGKSQGGGVVILLSLVGGSWFPFP